jgi:hypothetical protein
VVLVASSLLGTSPLARHLSSVEGETDAAR